MHLLIQRVTEARVTIAGETAGAIGHGLLVLVCAEPPDTEAGRMNRSVQDMGGGLLIVSQFTLAADTRQGNRPSFTGAAPAAQGQALYDAFVAEARRLHPTVATGRFGADMQVALINDGPVTIPMQM